MFLTQGKSVLFAKYAEVVSSNEITRLENDSFCFKSTGNDPQLTIKYKGELSGWVLIEWIGNSEEYRNLKLYINYGNHFNEENSIILGSLDERIQKKMKIVYFSESVKGLRVDPGEQSGKFNFNTVKLTKINKLNIAELAIKNFIKQNGFNISAVKKIISKSFNMYKQDGIVELWKKSKAIAETNSWHINEFSKYDPQLYKINREVSFHYNPLITLIIINKETGFIRELLTSIELQSYKNIELVLIAREKIEINNLRSTFIDLANYKNSSEATQSAIASSEGDYITILTDKETLDENALWFVVECVNNNDSLDILYTDEDRIFQNERCAPIYKRDYSINQIVKMGLINRFTVVKRELLNEINIENYNNSNDLLEYIRVNKVNFYHIPKVLVNKRIIQGDINEEQKVKTIAFYLPQFHPIKENNEWWGKGFTEWTNVTKATPLYKDHYQPHLPSDLGFYDLRLSEARMEQVELAKKYGIYGFCYYYYWFNGKRLLERPLNEVLESDNPDFPFCICWANESWSRRWDGTENEVLMQQVHNEESDEKFIYDILQTLKDKRYIKVNNSPIILIYRISLFPNPKETINKWRKICANNGIPNIHVSIVQSFGIKDPREYGCDSAVEFPPHGIVIPDSSYKVEGLNKEFKGNAYDYNDVVSFSLLKKMEDFPIFRGAMLGWDNTARKGLNANFFYNFSIEEYEKWLSILVDFQEYTKNDEEKIIFINAWNEWAEGTHLEPDRKNGHAYLEATKRALFGVGKNKEKF